MQRAVVFSVGFVVLNVQQARADDLWVNPIERVFASAGLFDEDARPYDTSAREQQVAGSISFACEHLEGDPCGDGVNAYGDLDSRAGYGTWVSASTRLRLQAGDSTREGFRVNRAHLDFDLPYVAAEFGRDAIVLGPTAHTQLSWGDNAPPIDHGRITVKPFHLGSFVQATGLYAVGRLRNPQTYPGALVSIGRGELQFGNNFRTAIVHLMQVDGDGAPQLSLWEFIAEHFRRKDLSGADDTSNRRFGGDVEGWIPALGVRLYYVLVFEDIRKARWMDAVRYDADHLFGIGVPHATRNVAVTVEYHQTGFRSQTHSVRTTGFTNGGYVVGSPLGPEASSWYASALVTLPHVTLLPALEYAVLSSGEYRQVNKGPIELLSEGHSERRYRGSLGVRIPIRHDAWAEVDAKLEYVTRFAFVVGDNRTNAGVEASIVWYPGGMAGRLLGR